MNFACEAEHLLPEWGGNPEAGLPLEIVQDGLHGGQKDSGLGLKQQAQDADGPKAKLTCCFTTAPLVQQDGLRMNLNCQGQSDEDYEAYKGRACFSNAMRRAADAFVGLVFRKAPFVKIPESQDGIGKAMARFSNDADMLGRSFFGYAKNVVREVISVGRSGTLVDWESDYEQRACATACRAEDILNWRVGRVNGRNVPVMLIRHEWVALRVSGAAADGLSAQVSLPATSPPRWAARAIPDPFFTRDVLRLPGGLLR